MPTGEMTDGMPGGIDIAAFRAKVCEIILITGELLPDRNPWKEANLGSFSNLF